MESDDIVKKQRAFKQCPLLLLVVPGVTTHLELSFKSSKDSDETVSFEAWFGRLVIDERGISSLISFIEVTYIPLGSSAEFIKKHMIFCLTVRDGHAICDSNGFKLWL